MSADRTVAAIGGYFSLECGRGEGLPDIDDAIGYVSARSAISAVLEVAKPARIWAPNFICGAVNDTLREFGAPVSRYALTDSRGVPDGLALGASDLLICVDYFGIHTEAVDAAVDRFGEDRVLIDASQSLYLSARANASTVYSPRKFFGVPDGGLLRTPLSVPAPGRPNEADSFMRARHLLARKAGLVELGYALFQDAEASLGGCPAIAMSQLTSTILHAVDASDAARRRIANYHHLAELVGDGGCEVLSCPADAVPLCCPVICNDAMRVRRELAEQHIFTPIYWPDAQIPDNDVIGLSLRDRTVYLPCDQRYGETEMLRVASVFFESTGAA